MKELQQIASRIADWQKKQGLSDAQLLRKFSGLGSTKTFGRIVEGDVAGLDGERWLIEYRSVESLIEALSDGASEDEPLYDDLSTCARLRVAALDAMRERGLARLVICTGGPGSGKTCGSKALVSRYGSRILLVEANVTWATPQNFLGGLLHALGVRELPPSGAGRLEKVLELLHDGERCVVIDEAHHMGVPAFNLLKTLINQTSCTFVLLALPVLLRRIEMQAWEEIRQLTQNRLLERVKFEGLVPADAEKFLARRLSWSNGEIKQAVALVREPAARYGQLAFLTICCRQAKRLAGKDDVTLEIFTEAVRKAVETR